MTAIQSWDELLDDLAVRFGKRPNLEALLFLIGINELGTAVPSATKEVKQDLMHIAICRLLSFRGYYAFRGKDADGWPVWEIIAKPANQSLAEQENLLQELIVEYFNKMVLI